MHLNEIKCNVAFFCQKKAARQPCVLSLNLKRIFMKTAAMTLFIAFATILQAKVAHGQRAMNKLLSLEVKGASLKEVLKDISSKTGVQFTYKTSDIAPFTNLNYQIRSMPLDAALKEILADKQLQAEQVGSNIVIKKKQVTGSQHDKIPQEGFISKVVVDEKGNPLPGVNVHFKGLAGSVSANEAGRFSLQPVPNASTIIFTYLGFKTLELNLDQVLQLEEIVLASDLGLLDEVTVIGYGTTTKRLSTGATAGISSADIAAQPINNPLSALQGRVAGLEVSSTNGLTASGFTVRIRGVNSVGSANDPLYIIDGVPFFSEPLNQGAINAANGLQSPLASINPADIERIDVLKDADATSIYGSRGANGVILITTKKGKAGKTQTTFDFYTGVGKASNKVDMLTTPQYLTLRREAFANDGMEPGAGTTPDISEWDQQATTNWQDLLMGRTAKTSEAKMSINGGNENTTFLMSGTYRHESSVLPGDNSYNKGSTRLSLDHTSSDRKFNASGSISYTGDVNNMIATDLTQYYNLPPNMPIYNEDGSYFWYGNIQNPIAYLDRSSENKTKNLIANGTLRYTPLQNLNVKANFGYTDTRLSQVQVLPASSFNPVNATNAFALYNNTTANSYVIEPQVDYTITQGKGQLQLLAGGTWQQSIRELTFLQGDDYATDAQLSNIQAAASLTTRNYVYRKYKYQAVFARANYSWNNKYVLNATFRRDGSSRFGPNKRFGNFGAVGAAWVFSEESYVKDHLPALSFGKLRGSYGTTGNDQIGDYQYLDSWDYVNYPYGGITGLRPARVYNPDYSWESNKKLEFGLELGFFGDRISLTTDFYRNRSGNQLLDFVLSPQAGFEGYITNLPALVQNKGWEFQLNTVNIHQERFNWTSSLNLTLPSNKLLEYPGLIGSAAESIYAVGYPLSVTKGYRFTSVDPNSGLAQYADLNGDGAITAGVDDQYVLGSDIPKFYGGFQNSLRYRNWELDVLLQFVKQEGPLLNFGYSASQSMGIMANFDTSVLERWQQAGQQTELPRASATASNEAYTDYNARYRLSSALWGDASFVRLKNVALRYNLTQALQRLKLQNAVIYLQGNNLFTITGYKGFDPETQGMAMPPLRLYTIGLQITL